MIILATHLVHPGEMTGTGLGSELMMISAGPADPRDGETESDHSPAPHL